MASSTSQLKTCSAGFLPILAVALLVGACADSMPTLPKISSLNPFAKKEVPLPGKRVPILDSSSKLQAELAPASKPVVLPVQQANQAWAQPGGMASNAPGHLALGSGLKRSWSSDAGSGTNSKARLTASPVAYGGRVYTLGRFIAGLCLFNERWRSRLACCAGAGE